MFLKRNNIKVFIGIPAGFKVRDHIAFSITQCFIEPFGADLKKILTDEKKSIYQELKRDNIVDEVRRKFGEVGLEE